ncbi:SAM-dependent methyltransferase [Salinifilum aidingensis]
MTEQAEGPLTTPHVDPTVAHNARVWDYWLGGKDNYAVDREAGDRVRELFPGIATVARADRAFLARAVGHLVQDRGVQQFLDIGTGLPAADNTHEVAQWHDPSCRVVYVDNDPLVLAHARALLTSDDASGPVDYLHEDARNVEAVLDAAAGTLDFGRPVALMLLGVLNFLTDVDEARRTVERLTAAVPSGSYVVLSHPTTELGGEENGAAMEFWNANATPPITARSGAQIRGLLGDLEVQSPGLVSCADWDPGAVSTSPPEEAVPQYAAVARKP